MQVPEPFPEAVAKALCAAYEACVQRPNRTLCVRIAQSYLLEVDSEFLRRGIGAAKTQILYALSNLAWWRGSEARDAKAELRRFVGDI